MSAYENLLGRPEYAGLMGVVECDHSGTVVYSEGEDLEALANILVYFQQVADLIGEAFGLDPMEEGQILGKTMTAVCLPKEETDLGVLLSSKTRLAMVMPKLKEHFDIES